jgi:hypothetical protein
MENRLMGPRRNKVDEPAGCFFHGSPGAPFDFLQVQQHLVGVQFTTPQRDFMKVKDTAEAYVRFDFYVGYSYGCRVLIDILNEMIAKNLVSHDSLKRKRVFLIAPFLVGEDKLVLRSILGIPFLGDFILSLKKRKIAREFANKVALPFEPASRLLESTEAYTENHFKSALFEKKSTFPNINNLSQFKTYCLIPEKDQTIDTNAVQNQFSKVGKVETLPGASHSCLWTHSLAISEWILTEYNTK